MVFMAKVQSGEFGEGWIWSSSGKGEIQLHILYVVLVKDRVKIKEEKVKKLSSL